MRNLTHSTRTRSANEHANRPLRTSRSARVVRAKLIWQESNMSVRDDPGSISLAPRAPLGRLPRAARPVDRARASSFQTRSSLLREKIVPDLAR